MTLSDVAKEYHVSAQAIRNRLQRAGYTLDAIREPGTNQISADGERIIKDLFTAAPIGQKQKKEKQERNQGGKASGSGNKLAVIQAENHELKLQAATAAAIAEERQKTIDILMEQIREKDATISKLAAAAAVKAALPEPEPAPPPVQDPEPKDHRRGLFDRFRKKKKKG